MRRPTKLWLKNFKNEAVGIKKVISPPLLTTAPLHFWAKKIGFYFMPEWVEKINKNYFSWLHDKIQVLSKEMGAPEIALAAFQYLFSKYLFQFTKHIMSSDSENTEFLQKCG